jgi:hypothetical protein
MEKNKEKKKFVEPALVKHEEKLDEVTMKYGVGSDSHGGSVPFAFFP